MEADVVEFYEKAETDPAFAADLEALKAKWKVSKPDRATFAADLIEAAKKHGITLAPDDFAEKSEELSEEELKEASGGRFACDVSIAPGTKLDCSPPLGTDPLRQSIPSGGVKINIKF